VGLPENGTAKLQTISYFAIVIIGIDGDNCHLCKSMKRLGIIVMTAAAILSCLMASAQGGGDALPFVRTEFGPALTGTAGAAVASAETGPWGVFRNASAMGFPGCLQGVAGEFRAGAGNFGFSGAGMAKIMNRIGFGLGASYLGGDSIGGFRTHDILVSGGIAYGIKDYLSIGINTRFAKQVLTESISYEGASIDINAMAKISYAMTATIGLSALGHKVVSASGTEYRQPANVYAGAEYVLGLEGHKLALDAMGEYYFSGNFGAALGASFTYEDMVTVRAGYRYASEWCVIPSHFALGLGGKYMGFTFDATFAVLPSSYITCASIGFNF